MALGGEAGRFGGLRCGVHGRVTFAQSAQGAMLAGNGISRGTRELTRSRLTGTFVESRPSYAILP
jgi:hypothetical protein